MRRARVSAPQVRLSERRDERRAATRRRTATHTRQTRRRPGSACAGRAFFRDNGWWRWGESNPRPSLSLHAFSGRSLCRRSARLRPLSQTPKSTSPVWEESHVTSRRRHTARPLDDARVRSGVAYGLTDYRARLRSEGEVSALCIGTYWFAEIVNEITLHPRPASRGDEDDVETDHPRESSGWRAVVTLWNCQSQMPLGQPSITVYNASRAVAFPRGIPSAMVGGQRSPSAGVERCRR